MDLNSNLVTIEAAASLVGISHSAIGYWIVTGQLETRDTAHGQLVNLAYVRLLAAGSNLAAMSESPDEMPAPPERSESTSAPEMSSPPVRGAALPSMVDHNAAEMPRAGETVGVRPGAPGSFEAADRQARIERRMNELEDGLRELRELVQAQSETITDTQEELADVHRRLHESHVHIVEGQPASQIQPAPEEPLMTIRLRPAIESDPPATHASPAPTVVEAESAAPESPPIEQVEESPVALIASRYGPARASGPSGAAGEAV